MSGEPATKDTRKGSATRERLLDAAESAILEKGFAGTSIDELYAAAGITKSGFFYHFKDKGALARELLERYIAREDALFDELFGRADELNEVDELFGRADELNEDPLHGFLVGLKMLSEIMADLPSGHPGCLIAAYCYQERLFDAEVRAINTAAVLNWRKRFSDRLHLIAERYPLRIDADIEDMADMLSVIADGGIILSKAVGDPKLLSRQILLYRDFVRTAFIGN